MKSLPRLVRLTFKCISRIIILAHSTLSNLPTPRLISKSLTALPNKIKRIARRTLSSLRVATSPAQEIALTSKSVKTLLNLQVAFAKLLITLRLSKELESPSVIWIHGPSGSGKSQTRHAKQ